MTIFLQNLFQVPRCVQDFLTDISAEMFKWKITFNVIICCNAYADLMVHIKGKHALRSSYHNKSRGISD